MYAPFLRLLRTPCSSYHRMLKVPPHAFSASCSFQSYISPGVCFAKKRPLDSNAESFRKRKFGFRYGDIEEEGDEIDEDESYEKWIERGSGFVDKAIDNIFIFKVLKSYGWMLPFIIISLLLVSGPKAFLFTFGIALGLSLIVYAFQNLFGEPQSTPRRKSRRKRRSAAANNKSNVYAKPDKTGQTRKESIFSRATRNDNSVGNKYQGKPYGGWDELDEAIDYKAAPAKTPDTVDSKDKEIVEPVAEPLKMPEKTKVQSELNRLNRRRREMSRTPLLLRLLVATFPFLNSWIKLL